MYKISQVHELNQVSGIPAEVIEKARDILTNINREYSNHDLENSDGGYVVLYSGGDLSEFSKINLDIKNLIPEHTTIIKCQNDVDYINSLILCNNDFTISICMRADVAPENLLICWFINEGTLEHNSNNERTIILKCVYIIMVSY